MWHAMAEKMESGRRVVAVFNDGSGATLFLVHDHGVTDHNGDDYSAVDPGSYERWAYLPDDFRLWGEDNVND